MSQKIMIWFNLDAVVYQTERQQLIYSELHFSILGVQNNDSTLAQTVRVVYVDGRVIPILKFEATVSNMKNDKNIKKKGMIQETQLIMFENH